jgi:hypothetical protein
VIFVWSELSLGGSQTKVGEKGFVLAKNFWNIPKLAG